MLAVYVEKPDFENPIAAVKVGDRPLPIVPDGWVRVKVAAASLNWHDLWTLRGMGAANGRPEVFPMILGCDGVGTLDDGTPVIIYPVIGNPQWKGDETLDPAREVLSERYQGSFAEFVAVPGRNALPLPSGLSLNAASVLGASWLTAYRMLFTKSGLRPGQTMLVQGASGGVATALIQLGAAAGMCVWATGRTPEKRALAEQLGASRTFETGETLPMHVDAVLDTTGAATWEHSLRSVRTGGTVVACGATTGHIGVSDIARIFIEQITIRGVFAGTLDEMRDLVSFVLLHRIEPFVGTELPVMRAVEGLQAMSDGSAVGKIVFTMT